MEQVFTSEQLYPVSSGLLGILWQRMINSNTLNYISSVQSLSRVRLFATPWISARQTSLSITNSRSSLRLTSIESVIPSSHLILCRPFSFCPQSLPASESFPMSQLLAWGGQSTGFSFSIIPSKEGMFLGFNPSSFLFRWLAKKKNKF